MSSCATVSLAKKAAGAHLRKFWYWKWFLLMQSLWNSSEVRTYKIRWCKDKLRAVPSLRVVGSGGVTIHIYIYMHEVDKYMYKYICIYIYYILLINIYMSYTCIYYQYYQSNSYTHHLPSSRRRKLPNKTWNCQGNLTGTPSTSTDFSRKIRVDLHSLKQTVHP